MVANLPRFRQESDEIKVQGNGATVAELYLITSRWTFHQSSTRHVGPSEVPKKQARPSSTQRTSEQSPTCGHEHASAGHPEYQNTPSNGYLCTTRKQQGAESLNSSESTHIAGQHLQASQTYPRSPQVRSGTGHLCNTFNIGHNRNHASFFLKLRNPHTVASRRQANQQPNVRGSETATTRPLMGLAETFLCSQHVSKPLILACVPLYQRPHRPTHFPRYQSQDSSTKQLLGSISISCRRHVGTCDLSRKDENHIGMTEKRAGSKKSSTQRLASG